jgi:hypothetical protein
MKLGKLNEMCLTETYKVCIGKSLLHAFPIQNGLKQGVVASSQLLFNFAGEICHQEGLELNGTHHFLLYAYNVNILWKNTNTMTKEYRSPCRG